MIVSKRQWPRWGYSCLAACLLAGCGNQAANSPPPNATTTAAPPAAPPAQPPATAAPAPAQEGQNASVAELLGEPNTAPSSSAERTVPPAPAPAVPAAGADASAPAAATATRADSAPAIDDVEYARVVSVARIPGPRQICTDRTVVERRRPEDEHRVAGTVIGAIAGGLIGSKVGRGSGRTVATVGGAVAGGAIGREVQGEHQKRDTVTRVVKHCRPVRPSEEGKVLYDVVYSYQGQNFHVRLDYDPGDRIALPVRGVD